MPITFAALMCHAPIVVPAVGGAEAARCRRTTRAMREVAARLVAARPDRVVLISPHSPRHRTTLAAWSGRHQGDLAAFRAPQVRVDLPDAPEVAATLGLPTLDGRERLDHGAVVPLSFLVEAGWQGPTAILALPWTEGAEEAAGRALATLPGRTAVVASGDMSHALSPSAPAGFHPDAAAFDAAFVDALRRDDDDAARTPPHRAVAHEDVVASTAVALAAVPTRRNAEVVAYEAPFGVGYTEAVLHDDAPPLWAQAAHAVRAAVRGESYVPPSPGPGPASVFVSLHRQGTLRGCIGHIEPQTAGLHAEVAAVAPLAALEDPRFPPVTVDELDDLDVEVSVLEPPEDVHGPGDLDPRTYGVIVSAGGRRGLLLPDLDGVDDVDTQVAIARRKAGIAPGVPVRLQRFRVRREAQP